MNKYELPRMLPQKFTSLMELDIATAQAIQNGKNGLKEELRVDVPEEILKFPEYYELLDPRKPAKKIIYDKLYQVLDEIFDIRSKIEKTMNRNELRAYDSMLASHLTPENLIPRIKKEVDREMNWLTAIRQIAEEQKEGEVNEEM